MSIELLKTELRQKLNNINETIENIEPSIEVNCDLILNEIDIVFESTVELLQKKRQELIEKINLYKRNIKEQLVQREDEKTRIKNFIKNTFSELNCFNCNKEIESIKENIVKEETFASYYVDSFYRLSYKPFESVDINLLGELQFVTKESISNFAVDLNRLQDAKFFTENDITTKFHHLRKDIANIFDYKCISNNHLLVAGYEKDHLKNEQLNSGIEIIVLNEQLDTIKSLFVRQYDDCLFDILNEAYFVFYLRSNRNTLSLSSILITLDRDLNIKNQFDIDNPCCHNISTYNGDIYFFTSQETLVYTANFQLKFKLQAFPHYTSIYLNKGYLRGVTLKRIRLKNEIDLVDLGAKSTHKSIILNNAYFIHCIDSHGKILASHNDNNSIEIYDDYGNILKQHIFNKNILAIRVAKNGLLFVLIF